VTCTPVSHYRKLPNWYPQKRGTHHPLPIVQVRSRRQPFIVVMEAAYLGDLDHLATLGRLHGSWLRAFHLKRKMRAPAMIIRQIAYQCPLQMPLAEHDNMV